MRRSRLAVGAAALLAVGITVSASGQPKWEVGSTFGPAATVGMSRGEPLITSGPDGTMYVAAAQPLGRDSVFSSSDHGTSWTAIPGTNLPWGGGDDALLVTPDNTMWLTGQEPGSQCESVARSVAGAAFVTQPLACATPADADRPWLAASSRGLNGQRIYLYFNQAGKHTITASDDGGLTWSIVGTLPAGHFPGNLVVDDAAGYLYAVTTLRAGGHESGLVVYRSADGGAHWTTFEAAPLRTGDRGLSHVFLTADTDGNLYTAWADDPDGAGMRIWFARSLDHAQTWSAPVLISEAGGTQVFPAISAGSPGRVAVAWYATSVTGDANTIEVTAAWHPEAATTRDGGVHWSRQPVSTTANHHGPLCTKGASCTSSARRLLDFLGVTVDPDGRAAVVWSDDNTVGIDAVYGPVTTFSAHTDPASGLGARPFD